MALPPTLETSLTPQELTFVTEEQEIEIVPSFSMSKIRLVSGVYGPFDPPRRATVPLWLALSLKRKRKCRIVPPDWLSPEILSAMVQEEMNEPHALWANIPRHLFETAKVLLDVAPTDLPDPAQIRSILLHLRHLRLAKIRSALRPPPPTNTSHLNPGEEPPADTGAFSGRGEYMSLTGFTPLEVAQMRGLFGGVLKVVGKLSESGDGMEVDA
ncbi:DNA replication protein psf2 [Naganishia albida]|nr:DNA replication protein psf2 [Naganishia albida]